MNKQYLDQVIKTCERLKLDCWYKTSSSGKNYMLIIASKEAMIGFMIPIIFNSQKYLNVNYYYFCRRKLRSLPDLFQELATISVKSFEYHKRINLHIFMHFITEFVLPLLSLDNDVHLINNLCKTDDLINGCINIIRSQNSNGLLQTNRLPKFFKTNFIQNVGQVEFVDLFQPLILDNFKYQTTTINHNLSTFNKWILTKSLSLIFDVGYEIIYCARIDKESDGYNKILNETLFEQGDIYKLMLKRIRTILVQCTKLSPYFNFNIENMPTLMCEKRFEIGIQFNVTPK